MMRSFPVIATLSLVLLVPSVSRADTFLGKDDDSSDGRARDEAAPSAKKKKKKKKARVKSEPVAVAADNEVVESASAESASDDSAGGGSGSSGSTVFSGALGAGAGYINAQITLGYYFNKYVGIDTSFYYYSLSSHDDSGTQYGPEVDLVLRGANPTIVTPYLGVGPGYSKWQRKSAGEVFDSHSSWTGNEFAGVDVRLTSHFGIDIRRKQQTYLNSPPKSFDDHKTAEAKSTWSWSFGFRVAF